MDEVRSGMVRVPGGEIYYELRGQGPPVVLVHSIFLDRRMWDPQFDRYATGFSVIRYDLRGNGRSPRGVGDPVRAADLAALADHLGLGPAFVVGASVGARVAAEWAARSPDRVRGLVLVGGIPADLDPTPEEEERFLEGAADPDERILALARSGANADAVEAMLDAWAPAADGATRARLGKIAADNISAVAALGAAASPERAPPFPVADTLRRSPIPVLLLCGDRDEPALRMMMGRYAQQLPHGHFVELRGGDHTPNQTVPEEFDRLVLEFLSRTPERRAPAASA